MLSAISLSLVIGAILFVLWFSYYIKIHDYILIVLIGIISTVVVAKREVPADAGMKWVGLEFGTMVLFWWTCKQYRRHWRDPIFWTSMAALLLLHLGVCITLLRHVTRFQPIWFLIALPVEVVPMAAILDWAIRLPRTQRRGHHPTKDEASS